MKSNLFACCFVMSSFVDFLSKKAENDTKRYGRIFRSYTDDATKLAKRKTKSIQNGNEGV